MFIKYIFAFTNDIKAAAPDSTTAQAVDSIQINWDK
jgi:hypothetical protein